MYIVQRPFVDTSSHHTCSFHKRHPGRSFPGCTCSSQFSSREKRWDEMTIEEKEWYVAALCGERPDGSSLF